jgi:putative tryptophan/tyrosine transport system substrate-binding protein
MNRRVFVAGLGAVLAVPLAAGAQATKRVAVLGVTPSQPVVYEMFKQGVGEFRSAGVVFVEQHADGRPDRLAAAAAKLVRERPDVIFARGPASVGAAMQATRTIPIVAVDLESDPIVSGYAKSLARPGGNVTGVFLDLPELSAKQLQLVHEVVPSLSRVALLGDSHDNAAQLRATERAAKTFGVQVQTFEGRTAAELDAGLEAAGRTGAGAVLIFSSPIVFAQSTRIAAIARDKRLPTVSLFTEFAEVGGLLTYGPSIREAQRRCGVYVAKILSGAKPSELPIERPEKFELVINLKTAKALGLTIPPSLLLRADQVIE